MRTAAVITLLVWTGLALGLCSNAIHSAAPRGEMAVGSTAILYTGLWVLGLIVIALARAIAGGGRNGD